jgi:hypothetical protein
MYKVAEISENRYFMKQNKDKQTDRLEPYMIVSSLFMVLFVHLLSSIKVRFISYSKQKSNNKKTYKTIREKKKIKKR